MKLSQEIYQLRLVLGGGTYSVEAVVERLVETLELMDRLAQKVEELENRVNFIDLCNDE